MEKKIKELAERIELEQIERLKISGLDCEGNILHCKTSIIPGKKYIKIDIGGSGKLMIDQEGNIFGIKGYGVINKSHYFGTLDTVNNYFWGEYQPQKKVVK